MRIADSRAQEFEATGAHGLRLFNPGRMEGFQGFNALCGMVLHALKYDHPIAGCNDPIMHDLEIAPKRILLNLVLNQSLNRLFQAVLQFADAEQAKAWVEHAIFDAQAAEEVRFARTATAMRCLVSGGLEEGRKDPWGVNCEGRQFVALPAETGPGRHYPRSIAARTNPGLSCELTQRQQTLGFSSFHTRQVHDSAIG